MSEQALAPCPFCGGPARTERGLDEVRDIDVLPTWNTGCDTANCAGTVDAGHGYYVEGDSIAAWNRRADTLAVPEGWRLIRIDASIEGRVSAMLQRDAAGTKAWHQLDESGRETTELFASGTGSTPAEAVRKAVRGITPPLSARSY